MGLNDNAPEVSISGDSVDNNANSPDAAKNLRTGGGFESPVRGQQLVESGYNADTETNLAVNTTVPGDTGNKRGQGKSVAPTSDARELQAATELSTKQTKSAGELTPSPVATDGGRTAAPKSSPADTAGLKPSPVALNDGQHNPPGSSANTQPFKANDPPLGAVKDSPTSKQSASNQTLENGGSVTTLPHARIEPSSSASVSGQTRVDGNLGEAKPGANATGVNQKEFVATTQQAPNKDVLAPAKDPITAPKDLQTTTSSDRGTVALQGNKGDVGNTQTGANQTAANTFNRADSARSTDAKVEPVKTVEPSAPKDVRSFGALPEPVGQKFESGTKVESGQKLETGSKIESAPKVESAPRIEQGQKIESGSRIEPAAQQTFGNKQDAGNKAEQMVRGIEGRVNDSASSTSHQPATESGGKAFGTTDGASSGVKQPHGADSQTGGVKQPNPVDSSFGVRQPGSADSSAAGGRQPADSSNVGSRQPANEGVSTGTKQSGISDATSGTKPTAHDAGDKVSSGGGGSTVAGESTKRIDIGTPIGSKSDGQIGASGMGGGSSAPVERAPHGSFNVEEAQAGKANLGDKGTIGEKGVVGDKGGVGQRFDTGETRGNQPGARFDTPELRGNQPGARFDTPELRGNEQGARFDQPELRGGKAGGASGSPTGDVGGGKSADSGIGKGLDASGGKGGSGGGSGGFSGSGESTILGDKRQPPVIPDGIIGHAGKDGKNSDAIPSGAGSHGDDGVPFVLPGGIAGQKQNSSSKKPQNKAQKSDAGIPVIMPGQIGAGPADVGGVLRNFAQNVLGENKTDPGAVGKGEPPIPGQKDAVKQPGTDLQDGKTIPSGDLAAAAPAARMDFAGPRQKTRILEEQAGERKAADDTNSDEIEAEVEESVEKPAEDAIEDSMHYELALGLQLYTSIAEAPYGAYHYYTKEGDTVETVSRDVVGDVRCAPLVFSLNKEHIVVSTEYGVHPFKVGVMIQLPTPRDLKEFFGNQA